MGADNYPKKTDLPYAQETLLIPKKITNCRVEPNNRKKHMSGFDRFVLTLAMFRMTWIMRRAVVESNPDVGSSRNSKDGSTRISCPMLTRFLSPPETPRRNGPPMIVSRHLIRRKEDKNHPLPPANKYTNKGMNNVTRIKI